MAFSKWVLDVSLGKPYGFCPYIEETDEVVSGLTMIQPRCPGELVGLWCAGDGIDKIPDFVMEHPDWRNEFAMEAK